MNHSQTAIFALLSSSQIHTVRTNQKRLLLSLQACIHDCNAIDGSCSPTSESALNKRHVTATGLNRLAAIVQRFAEHSGQLLYGETGGYGGAGIEIYVFKFKHSDIKYLGTQRTHSKLIYLGTENDEL